LLYLPPSGELAQLARALAWHARGHRFDSGILHRHLLNEPLGNEGFFFSSQLHLCDTRVILNTKNGSQMHHFGSQMGHKSPKGAVSISNNNGRVRLRWRYEGVRYSLNLFQHTAFNLLEAKKVALIIQQDMLMRSFDVTLSKYGSGTPLRTGSEQTLQTFPTHFERWVKEYKQMDCELHTNYNSTRNMIRKWGKVTSDNVLTKFNAETFCAGTYNRRLTILKSFINWMVVEEIWKRNPLSGVRTKKVKREKQKTREPFSVEEISRILHAIKTDAACARYSATKHSYYYEFVYFLFKTGVRNAEAIGLRVGSVDLCANVIYIKEVLARSMKSSSSAQRIRKSTKNGKERVLPLTTDLRAILSPLVMGKGPDDLVFVSPTGKAIDDNNFRNRIFKKVLSHLGIPYRVIYAIRHSFASRCIDEGLTPVVVSFLLGNHPLTALKTYTHQISLPKDLPPI